MKQQNVEVSTKELESLREVRQTMLAQLYSDVKINLQGNTYWEEITCVGYLPEKKQLEAVVEVKRSSGYSGGLCQAGSFEYVRFFVDWGSGFQDIGFTSFKVHDISDAPAGAQHPLNYLAVMSLNEEQHQKFCISPVLPKIRAVLSWNSIPSTSASATPVFGNAVECHIQINARFFLIKDVLDLVKEKVDFNFDFLKEYKLDIPIPKSANTLLHYDLSEIGAYRSAKVPDHRTFYPVAQALAKPTSSAEKAFSLDKSFLKEFEIDLSKLIKVIEKDKANVSFEELLCVGLNTAGDKLGAIIHIKKPSGYGGSLCKKGSFEHVAFWADWNNNGTWDQYLGTTSVRVHDIGNLPEGGLCYAVELPISKHLLHRLRPCIQPNIVKMRAVLSWSSPPSATDPNDLNTWGNRVDAIVQIRPGKPIQEGELGHRIDFIGNVTVDQIDPSSHLAFPSAINGLGHNRPWGRSINFRAEILNTGTPGNVHFQVQYFDTTSGKFVPVNDSHTFTTAEPAVGGGTLYNSIHINASDYGGWFPYLADPSVGRVILSDLLAYWNTGTKFGPHKVRLAFTTDHNHLPANIQYSEVYEIMLDNVFFNVNPAFGAAVNPAYTLDLVIDGGDCHQYEKGSSFNGHLRVIDKYFGKWSLHLEPTSHYTGNPISPPNRIVTSMMDQGDANAAWQLDTSTLDPCGYTVRLRGWKRTIFDSNIGQYHHRDKYVGFSVV